MGKAHSFNRLIDRLAAAFILAAVSSCAFSYTDSDNKTHFVGLLDISAQTSGDEAAKATALRIRTLGLYAYSFPDLSSGVSVGYIDQRILAVPDDFCLDLNHIGFCGDRASRSTSLLKEIPR